MIKIKEKHNYTINFALMFFIHYLTHSLITSQRVSFLIRSGYSIEQRSIMFAAVPLISISMQLFVGYLSDKYKTIKKIYVVFIVLSAIFAYLFYNIATQLFVYHFALTLLSNSLLGSLSELSDVWVLESKGPSKNSYGFIRAFGSFGWSVGSFLVAQVILNHGYQGLAITSLLFNILLLAIVVFIKDDKAKIDLEETIETIKMSDVKILFTSKIYLIAIAIIFVINFSANMIGYIIIDKMLLLGGNEWHIGFRVMIAAGVEIPLLLIGDQIHKKVKSSNMLLVGTLFFALQFLGYYYANSNNIIFYITIMQAVGIPFFTIAIKYLLLEISPSNLKTSGQIVGPALANGLLGILYPLISALLVRNYSINAPILLAAILAGIGFILSVYLKIYYKKYII